MAFNVRQIFSALNDAGADYVVVGGLAVILHGYLRATADLDLAVGLSPDNAGRAMTALATIGLRPRLPVAMEDFCDPERSSPVVATTSRLLSTGVDVEELFYVLMFV